MSLGSLAIGGNRCNFDTIVNDYIMEILWKRGLNFTNTASDPQQS